MGLRFELNRESVRVLYPQAQIEYADAAGQRGRLNIGAVDERRSTQGRRRRQRGDEQPVARGDQGRKRPGTSSRSPRQEPTLWERYQRRWAYDATRDKQLFETITRDQERWKHDLEQRFERPGGEEMHGVGPLALPKELAPQGQSHLGTAKSERSYAKCLAPRYRQRWEEEGIGERVREVAEQARTSLRGRLSRNPEQLAEDAVRRECGPQAQQFDKAMREDLNKYDPHWGVHVRIKCMRSEEARAEQERQEAIVRGQERKPDRKPDREQEPQVERNQVELSR